MIVSDKIVPEFEKISSALDMELSEFGQRAMRATILATGYKQTQEAEDDARVAYRRALGIKAGIATAAVYNAREEEIVRRDDFFETG